MTSTLYTLITGASSGLGRTAAIRLSQKRSLILHGRNLDRLEETRSLCDSSRKHMMWDFDLKNVGNLAESLSSFLSITSSGINAFVHCAGMVTVLPVRSLNYGSVHDIMNVNFFSALEIVNVLLKKQYNARNLKDILFISSIWSKFGSRAHSAYCASKAALDGLMRGMAVELAPAIRVNSILPGAIATPIATQALSDPEILENFERDYPMGLGHSDDIADAIEFLLSEKARWINGQQLAIDGGRTANMSLK